MQTGWFVSRQTDRWAGRQMGRWSDRLADRQVNRQAVRQTVRLADNRQALAGWWTLPTCGMSLPASLHTSSQAVLVS